MKSQNNLVTTENIQIIFKNAKLKLAKAHTIAN